MRIALDAMGGDEGPTPLVEGAIKAAKRYDCEILLVGKQHSLQRLLHHFRYRKDRIRVVPASQTVKMGESPRASLRQRDSSIAVATRLVREGEADALVSALSRTLFASGSQCSLGKRQRTQPAPTDTDSTTITVTRIAERAMHWPTEALPVMAAETPSSRSQPARPASATRSAPA